MFLFWNGISRSSCDDRYSLYRGGFVTCISLPQYRQPSPGFGVKYIILTLCGCGMAIFIYFHLLLGFLICSLLINNFLIMVYIESNIYITSLNAYNIDKWLARFKQRYTKNEYYIYLYPRMSLCHIIYNLVCLSWGFILFLPELWGYIGPFWFAYFILLDRFVMLNYNKSIFFIIKRFKDLFSLLIVFYNLMNILSLSFTNNMIFSLSLIILILIFIKLYINIINKDFKVNYPTLYSLLDTSLNVLLTICVSILLMFPYGAGPQSGSSGGSSGGPSGGSGQGPGGGPGGGPNIVNPNPLKRTRIKRKFTIGLTDDEWHSDNEDLLKSEAHSFYRTRRRVIQGHREWVEEEIIGKDLSPELEDKLAKRTIRLKQLLNSWKTSDKKRYPNIDKAKFKGVDDNISKTK